MLKKSRITKKSVQNHLISGNYQLTLHIGLERERLTGKDKAR